MSWITSKASDSHSAIRSTSSDHAVAVCSPAGRRECQQHHWEPLRGPRERFRTEIIKNQGSGAAAKRIEAVWFYETKTEAGWEALG